MLNTRWRTKCTKRTRERSFRFFSPLCSFC